MKRALSIILLVLTLASCVLCLSSCRQRNGSLEEINALLMQDPKLNELFSSIDVVANNGEIFAATLRFKNIESQDIREMSVEEGCAISKMVHDKIKKAVLQAGYKKICWIEAYMYASDSKIVDNDYVLSFGVAIETRVEVWADPYNPIWEETVSWGGFDEVE